MFELQLLRMPTSHSGIVGFTSWLQRPTNMEPGDSGDSSDGSESWTLSPTVPSTWDTTSVCQGPLWWERSAVLHCMPHCADRQHTTVQLKMLQMTAVQDQRFHVAACIFRSPANLHVHADTVVQETCYLSDTAADRAAEVLSKAERSGVRIPPPLFISCVTRKLLSLSVSKFPHL